jgi:hypothetical protein
MNEESFGEAYYYYYFHKWENEDLNPSYLVGYH